MSPTPDSENTNEERQNFEQPGTSGVINYPTSGFIQEI